MNAARVSTSGQRSIATAVVGWPIADVGRAHAAEFAAIGGQPQAVIRGRPVCRPFGLGVRVSKVSICPGTAVRIDWVTVGYPELRASSTWIPERWSSSTKENREQQPQFTFLNVLNIDGKNCLFCHSGQLAGRVAWATTTLINSHVASLRSAVTPSLGH